MKKTVIENQFKEKMNAREIIPSKASWDRLDAMLTVAEKPKRNFKWMYAAVAILGFLLIGTLYYNQNQKDSVVFENTVVTNEVKAVPETDTKTAESNLIKNNVVAKAVREQLASAETKLSDGPDSVSLNTVIQALENKDFQEQQTSIINQKTEQVTVPHKSNYVNADELLASVDNASQKKSSLAVKPNVKVNSNELLTQVDGELDLTFREKAIKTVNQNFKAAKLALSNRNSE